MPSLVRSPAELSTDWLADALGAPVRGFDVERIGTGQMSENYRVVLDWDGAADAVVLKVASSDPNSRATGVGLGAYEREIRFYREVAPRLAGTALARCHANAFDGGEGWFTLLLEDMAPAVQGDQIDGCSVDSAALALTELARIHAPLLGDPDLEAGFSLQSPLNQGLLTALWPGFLERYGDRVLPDHVALVERFLPSIDAWGAELQGPVGLLHGDFRLDNLLFGEPGAPKAFCVVDWQTCGWGPVLMDAAYFVGGGLSVDDRRAAEEDLLRGYCDGLGDAVSWDECWDGYRRGCFSGVLMAVAASMLVARTERGDDMFMTLLARHAQQAIDLDAVDLLPAAGAGRPAPLRPEPGDEGRHEPGDEQLWNESWYFDAVSADGSAGMYVRLGLYPNLGVAWYTAALVGAGRPTVMVVDYKAPLALDGFDCVEPLQTFRVSYDGRGESYDDAARALDGEAGVDVGVDFDLTWTTEGEPYSYRLATRYEIPCHVSGVVRIDGEELRIDGPGQRDHSWGPRDWWSMDWIWSALHMDDGARLHGVELRLPDLPRMGVGYVQTNEDFVECERVVATEGDGRLPASTAIELHPPGLAVDVEPIAFGPLRLVAPDGRVSEFPRALVRASTADGRAGVGWVEWNRNVPG